MASRKGDARSLLFLSCDLVGSTQFKQKEVGWQHIFLSFYRGFPQTLADADRLTHVGSCAPIKFELWKAVGDELIFKVEVSDERQISRAIRVWLKAMQIYEADTLQERPLALKGGAFVATFPGPDSESTIPREPTVETSDKSVVVLNREALKGPPKPTKFLYDYFGPSIDTGFRVVSMCSRRYFTLSVEAAWAVALAANDAATSKTDEQLHHVEDLVHHGSHVLKGVWDGREYPVFAVDREHTDPVNKALAGLGGPPLTTTQVIDVCHACSNDHNWPFRLFLPQSKHETFHPVPADAMASLYGNAQTLDGAETVPSADEGVDVDQSNLPLG